MHLTRRKVLGGAGALVALPALGVVRPRHAVSQPREAAPRRLLVYFLPNGRVPGNWIPPEQGSEFSFPAALAPFAGLKADMICLSQLVHTSALMSTGTGDLLSGSLLTIALAAPSTTSLVLADASKAPSAPLIIDGASWRCEAGGDCRG